MNIIVRPFHFHVAAGQPCPCHRHHFGLSGVEVADVVEGGGGFDEFALLELGFSHEQPSVAQEGVEFFSGAVGFVFLSEFFPGFGFRLGLDGVQLDPLPADYAAELYPSEVRISV